MRKTIIGLALSCMVLSSCGRKSMDEQFEEWARQETQQTCPRRIDECMVLDSVVYDIGSRTQRHFYTFSGKMDDESLFTDNFRLDIRESMLKALRNEIKLKKQMDQGINFEYVYRSESQKRTILNLVFTKKDYTGPVKFRTFEERMVGKWIDYTAYRCPEEQDEATVLDSVVFVPDSRTLQYSFTLRGDLDVEEFEDLYPDAQKEMKKVLAKAIRENESLKEENDSMISYRIRYYSKSTGRKLMDIRIKGSELK